MKLLIFLILLSAKISYSQVAFTKSFLIGKWTLEYGYKYWSFDCGGDEGGVRCDTTDCKGPWNYQFLKSDVLKFYDRDKDSIYSGRWTFKDSLLTLTFGTVVTKLLFPTKLSSTRIESLYKYVEEKKEIQSTYLHFRKN